MNKPIASVTYLPPCLCHHRGKGYDITTGKYVNPITRRAPSPVFMQVGAGGGRSSHNGAGSSAP